MRLTRLLAVPLILASAQDAAAQERVSLSGGDVAIYNLAGDVTIERGTGSDVVVEVTRGGRDRARLNVSRTSVDGSSALVIRYPDGDVLYTGGDRDSNSSTTLNVRDDGTFFGDGSRGDRVRIRTSGRGTDAHADLRILVPAGRSVDVKLAMGTVTASNVQANLEIDVASATVDTRTTRGTLRIDTGSGSVNVTGAEGDVHIDTGSGSVTANNVRGNDVLIDTGSGSVRGAAIVAPTLRIDTGSGRIAVSDVTSRDVVLDTGSGSVDISLTSRIDRLRVDTGSGSVSVSVPSGFGAALDIDTGSGGIQVDMPVNASSRGRNRLVGTVGDGRGAVEIDTGSGSVRIRSR